MKKILVVGLAVILAAAGNGRADGQNGKSDQSSAPSATTTTSARSTGSSNVQQGTVARSGGYTGASVVRHYPTNVSVQSGVPANVNPSWRGQRPFLDRSELLARQAMYYRSQVNPATVRGTNRSIVNTGQVRGGGQVNLPSQSVMRAGRHRGDQDASQNGTTGTGGTRVTNGTQGTNRRPIPATNSGLRGGKPVLNFNNSNTMNFTDACQRHRDRHDCDWWRNHCTTIILIGGGFYAWDLGYWYPAYGYDSSYSNYAYNGPIYGYDGLPPDQIIANVQYALQQLGYFAEAADGVLGPITRQAIEDYQLDNGLNVTGAIDRPTLVALGFIY